MENLKSRIEDEIKINNGRISEERLSCIAADFLQDAGEQTVIEKEIEIENLINGMGGSVVR